MQRRGPPRDDRMGLSRTYRQWPERPAARVLVVWLAFRLQVTRRHDGHSQSTLRSHGRIFGARQRGVSHEQSSLWSVFVEHDRSSHAERQALLFLNKKLEYLSVSHDACFIEGDVWLYGPHTPCISCLAVFCQFRRLYPS